MKIKPSTILLFFILIFSVGGLVTHYFTTSLALKTKIKQIEITETFYKGGSVYTLHSEIPFTGRLIDRYEDGSIRSIENYVEGKLHGLSETFGSSYRPNFISSRTYYNQGQKFKYEQYRDYRTLEYVFEYEDGIQTKSTVYNTDGSIKTVSEFNNGMTKIHVYGSSGSVEFTNHFDKNMNKIKTSYPTTLN